MIVVRSISEIVQLFKERTQSVRPDLTDWNEGSILDIYAGIISVATAEIIYINQERLLKHYFATATGIDLEFLATDIFGEEFARPLAQKAVGVVRFTRPNTNAGVITIPAGSIVKTQPDANGETVEFKTILVANMVGTTLDVSVEALIAGVKGNVAIDSITSLGSSLLDPSIVVTNPTATAGGKEIETDEEYRETILNKIRSLKGATRTAIESAVKEVSGVAFASVIEEVVTALEVNPATLVPTGLPFKIVRVKIFVADANGTASQALLDLVSAEVDRYRAAGVNIAVFASLAVSIDFFASITLNPSGPNFAELSQSASKIEDTMREFMQNLAVGAAFSRTTARNYVMSIWGPAGTNDLTNFVISIPTADVTAFPNQKIIAGQVEVI